MEGESVRPQKCQMYPYQHKNTGENTDTQRKIPLSAITSTEMNCTIKFRRVNVSRSVRGSRSRQPAAKI